MALLCPRRELVLLGCVMFAATLSRTAKGDDWDHWRGPTRGGVSAEPSGWDGKNWLKGELWRVSVGEGSSSPIVVGNRVYLTGWSNNRDTIYCFDADSGRELWRQTYKSPRYGRVAVGDQFLYSGACSTPEYDSQTGLLFTLGIDGDLIAWDTKKDGRRVWALNLYDQYRAPRRPEVAKRRKTRRDYGYTSSPLAIGGQLIVEVGGRSGNLVAFDVRNGRELWHSENRDEAGHTGGPVPIMVDGVSCVAVLTLRNLVVTRIDGRVAGKLVTAYPWTTDFGNNIATAAVSGDSVIITSAYNQSAMCRIRISLDGATKIWETKGMASGVCSPVIYKGRVYWAWRGVHCVDFDTGVERWSGGNVGSQGSCIVTSDERLIVYANKGKLLLVDSAIQSPEKYHELASQTVLSKTDAWPHVVLAGGRLYCRDRAGSVRCLAIR
jgi:outer membrane protein assembly factor BamB